MTLPQLDALMRFWRHTPPAALALKRLSLFVGLKPERAPSPPAATPKEALEEVSAAGLPVAHGRPNDPMLDLVEQDGW